MEITMSDPTPTPPAPTPSPAPAADPATPPVDPAAPPAAPADPAADPEGAAALGDAGKRALDAMKAERNAARDEARQAREAAQAQLDAIATSLGLKPTEQDPAQLATLLADAQRTAGENAAALTRYQVAVEKAVPSHLVEFVTGTTREEVEQSIEKVLAAFAAAPPTPPGTPLPDPSQGQQGAPASLDAQIAEAQKAGNTREVIRLKARKGLTPST